MKAHIVSSRDNPILKEYKKLLTSRSYRRKRGKIAVEGPNLVWEAIHAGLIPETLITTEEYNASRGDNLLNNLPDHLKQVFIAPKLFKELAETTTPQSIAAIFPFSFRQDGYNLDQSTELVVIADRLQDPGNLGTLIRTAAAAGVDLFFCAAGCTDPFSPKVLRASAGLIFRVGIEEVSDTEMLLKKLKAAGFTVIAAAGGSGHPYWSITYQKPLALVIGNEAGGVDPELLTKCDLVTAIPLQDSVESLNAAVAAGIILFEIRRQESAGNA